MVTIKSYHNLEDAELGRSLLESNGIQALVPNSATQSNLPFFNMMKAGVILTVHDEDVEEACRILGVEEVPSPPQYGVNWMMVFIFMMLFLVGFAVWSALK